MGICDFGGEAMKVSTISVKIRADFSLWDALKMRIAGLPWMQKHRKWTIEELIERDINR